MTEDGVKISIKEIYQVVLDISKRIERIEEKIQRFSDIDKKCGDALKEADEALRISKTLSTQAGWTLKAIVGAAIPLLVSIAVYHLQKLFGN